MYVNLITTLDTPAAQHAAAWQRRFFGRRGHTVTICAPTASAVVPPADLYIYHYPDAGPLLETLPALDRGVVILDCRQLPPDAAGDTAFARLVSLADLVVVPVQDDADLLAAAGLIDPGAVQIVAPAVALSDFSPGPADPVLLQKQGWLGRTVLLTVAVDEMPAIPDLLDAALDRVRAAIPHAVLAVIPAGADRLPFYRLAAIYLALPGDPTAPLYALEAQACGVPVVSVAQGGLVRLLEAAGLTALPDDPNNLAAKIVQLLGDDDLYAMQVQRSLACAAAHSREHYDLQWSAVLAAASAWLPNRQVLSPPAPAAVQSTPATPEPAGWSPGPSLTRLKSAAAVTFKGYRVRSAIPYAGPLIVWVRRTLTSHLREPYLDPVLQRQESFNWQATQAIEDLSRQIAALEQAAAEVRATHAELDAQLADLAAQVDALAARQEAPDADDWATLRSQLDHARSLLTRLQPPA